MTPSDTSVSVVRRRQVAVRAEQMLRRGLRLRRLLPLLLLVGLPLSVALLRIPFMPEASRGVPAGSTSELALLFQLFVLRFVVFFSCATVFVRLFRGEILDRCLHHSLLTPVPRPLLVLATWLGGVATTWVVLLPATVLLFVLYYLPHGAAGWSFVLGPGIGHVVRYLLVVALACIGYGALFTLAGLFFRNPMVPAILFLGWEMLTPFLPPVLKALSLVHYLSSFLPVPPTTGPLALVARPVAPPLALLALAFVTAVLLAGSMWKASRLEVTYSAE